MKSIFPLLLGLLSASPLCGQTLDFWSSNGGSPNAEEQLDGDQIYDHLVSSDYDGYVGEMFLMPEDQSVLAGASPGTAGIAGANSDSVFGAVPGLVGFCIDSETAFRNSSSSSETFEYQPYSFAAANERYNTEGVEHYLSGGLRRAAYMLDRFYQEAHDGGNLSAAALQVAIWEVLYDSTPDVSTGSGNYYVRNNAGNSTAQNNANAVIATVTQWYNLAAADNWGGNDFDPGDSVLFWLDPDATSFNQSIITLNPLGSGITAIPEPSTAALILIACTTLLVGRRRS